MDRSVHGERSAPRAGGHGHRRPTPSAPTRATSTSAASIPSAVAACKRRSSRPKTSGLAGQRHLRDAVRLPRRHAHRRRRLRLRRGDGADGLDRGQARHAPAAPALPRREGLWERPTLINNVETFANIPPIVRKGADVVRRHRHGEEQGNQGLLADRQDPQHRPDRGADGHAAAAHRRGDGRRRARRRQDQGGADGRPVRRLHSRRAPGHAGRLRVAARRSARSWARAA